MDGMRYRDSFVARIWLEGGPEGDLIWRGHIRQVKGKKEANFQGLEEMAEFMNQVVRARKRKIKGKETKANETK